MVGFNQFYATFRFKNSLYALTEGTIYKVLAMGSADVRGVTTRTLFLVADDNKRFDWVPMHEFYYSHDR